MGRYEKIDKLIMSGQSDNNISFSDGEWYIEKSGYKRLPRSHGGSHVNQYRNDNTGSYLNIQDKGGKIPSYQVREIRDAIKNDRKGDSK